MIVPLVREVEWLNVLENLQPWAPSHPRILVVSPHPDDETLSVGGIIAASCAAGKKIVVAAVTDGENAYGELPELGKVRRAEQEKALALLGVFPSQITRLKLPDRDVTGEEEFLALELTNLSSSETLILAPWPGDFHPDHEACGRAAQEAARLSGAGLAYYFFWTWHRGRQDTISGLPLRIFPLGPEYVSRKLDALACHESQLVHASGEPILPESLLAPAKRPFEVILPA